LSSAKALLADTISEEPDHALAHFNLGLLYQTEGNTEAADASFYEAEIINPSLVSEIKKAKKD
jgi:Tfp pilus assembly protein PilF